jgi:hypothetical protein
MRLAAAPLRAAALALSLLLSRRAAALAADRDLGLRGLATTWETDDDNSILQLVALPRAAAGAKVEVVGPFLWYDSPENSALELLPCAMAFDAGGANASSGGGGGAGAGPSFLFATGNALGPVAIYTVDAVSGALLRNVSVRYAQPLAVTAMAFNSASGLLDSLVFLGQQPAAASIDPRTGAVRILAAKLDLPDFQGPCEAAVAPHMQAGSRLYFVQQDARGWQRANETYLMGLDLATGNATRLVQWSPRSGMLSNVAAVDAAAPGGAELVLYTTSASRTLTRRPRSPSGALTRSSARAAPR